MSLKARCRSCGADWGAGKFGTDCQECGGGAMTRSCMYCGGRCGETMERAVSDSHDTGLGHWAGRCKLNRPGPGPESPLKA